MTADTIFAPATAPGRSAIAVVRISGPDAGDTLVALTGQRLQDRRASVVRIRDAAGSTIDHGMALWFSKPASATGEDVAELHVHGGRAVVAAVLGELGRRPGLRPAEPGEFIRRAFENGKVDLTEVEGLADLVAADTDAQRRQAIRQTEGALGRLYDGWRERLVGTLAHLEATIDFADEDLSAGLDERVAATVDGLAAEVAEHLADGHRGERLRDGFRVAILGPPKAGKSSLLNVLARRDVAIVSESAGTTRDVIEVHLDLAGYPVVVADTAGLRAAAGAVEEEGVRRARTWGEKADLRLLVFDGGVWPAVDAGTKDLIEPDRSLVVINKSDLGLTGTSPEVAGLAAIPVSAKTGDGLGRLVTALTEVAARGLDHSTNALALTRARHRTALERCLESLTRAGSTGSAELVAEDLRLAARELGRITGRIDAEDLLDVIFRDFCVGK